MDKPKDIVILSVDELISKIYEYQQHHDIKEECITNTQFVYNYIKKYHPVDLLKTVAVLVVGDVINEPNTVVICCNHILIKIDDEIIEPSYEYTKLENITYYFSYEEFFLSEYGKGYKCEYSKIKYLDKYMKMLKLSTIINMTENISTPFNILYYDELDKWIK